MNNQMFFNFLCIAINHIALIYCEELFVKLFVVPQPHLKKMNQPPLDGTEPKHLINKNGLYFTLLEKNINTAFYMTL